MYKSLLSVFLLFSSAVAYTQVAEKSPLENYSASSVFSHNDYLREAPFYEAYLERVGFIEADVFLQRKELLVAHTQEEIAADRSLEGMYLRPLQVSIRRNNGYVYADTTQELTLMIDIKSEANSTLSAIVAALKKYPEIINAATLHVVISGNIPAPEKWDRFPAFINFDGRPGINYTPEQLRRVRLISDNFTQYSNWNGRTAMVAADIVKIGRVRDEIRAKGKPVRLWATPDIPNAWATLMKLQIDVINTDHPRDAVKFVSRYAWDNFQTTGQQPVYRPSRTFSVGALPRNVILLISDGTGLSQIYAGYTANRGALNMFNMGTVGLSVTTASNRYITDSAAGATALSTGKKTNNGFVGVDSVGTKLPTIAEDLKRRGFHVAIGSSGDITDATPASFYAHQPDRGMSEPIALDFLSSDFDVLIGGRTASFNKRSDNQDLFALLQRKGYTVSDKLASLDTIRSTRFVVVDDVAGLRKTTGRGDFLTRSFSKANNAAVQSGKPFFMMFEGAQVDWGGHDNELPYLITEMLDFDAMVGEAIKFADHDGQTLVVVTADHETGGLSLVGGDIAGGAVRSSFSTGSHTAIPVPVFAFGPGAELFTGVYQNTEIYRKIQQLLKKN